MYIVTFCYFNTFHYITVLEKSQNILYVDNFRAEAGKCVGHV